MLETRPEPVSIDAPFRVSRPILRQSWLALTFLHWSFDPVVVRPLIPRELELDLWEGRIYVGLVPFILADLTLPKAPAVPWFSRFPETNVRTYVYDKQGRRGVWFFSLDAARLTAVIGARAGYALPYYWARMSVDSTGGSVDYRSQRRFGADGHTEIRVTPGKSIGEPSPLTVFLTARWSLFAHRRGRILRADIDHPRWPLQWAHVDALDESLLRAAGLPLPKGEPLAHFSAETRVMTGWRQRV